MDEHLMDVDDEDLVIFVVLLYMSFFDDY